MRFQGVRGQRPELQRSRITTRHIDAKPASERRTDTHTHRDRQTAGNTHSNIITAAYYGAKRTEKKRAEQVGSTYLKDRQKCAVTAVQTLGWTLWWIALNTTRVHRIIQTDLREQQLSLVNDLHQNSENSAILRTGCAHRLISHPQADFHLRGIFFSLWLMEGG